MNAIVSVLEAVCLVDGWEDLSTRRRGDLKSALLAVARLQGMPPGGVRLTPADLRTTFMATTASGYGISLSRQRNILSGLRYVMRRLDLIDEVAVPVTEAWSALLQRLDIRKRAELITFARFCSARQIAPPGVTDADLAVFEVQLTDRTLTPNPRKRVGRLKGFWNRSRTKIDGWPAVTLTRLRVHEYVRPLTAFPESFQADLAAFGERLARTALDDPFSEDQGGQYVGEDQQAIIKPHKPLRKSSIETRVGHLRWAASVLVATGVRADEITALKDLVQPVERVRTVLRYLHDRAKGGASAAGMHVAEALRIVAKYHAGLPACDIAKIKKWGQPVRLVYSGMTEKNEGLVRSMMLDHRWTPYRNLPAELRKQARALRSVAPRQAASIAFRAIAIRLLSRIPIRLENLRSLRLDKHLQRSDPRTGRISYIQIPAAETKNRREILLSISPDTADYLQEWIDDYRPIIAAPDCVFLFPGHGTGNTAITPQAFREAVRSIMAQRVGVPLTPHRFRHLAARRFLDAHPGEYESVRQFLNHASITTTTRHYSGTESDAAFQRLDEILDGPLKPSRRSPKRRR